MWDGGGDRQAGQRAAAHTHLFLAVFQHVLVLGELLVLFGLDALGLVPEPGGVLLLQPLDGLLLLPFQVLHLLVVLTLLTLRDTERGSVAEKEEARPRNLRGVLKKWRT